MLAKQVEKAKRDEGFTLIELLVVVIIIGILAAIAIPVFLNQRENAWRSAVESDLRNAAIAMETLYTREGSYAPADGVSVADGASVDVGGTGVEVTASQNVTLTITDTDQSFTITGVHANLTAAGSEDTLVYDSETGGLANSDWS